MSLRLTDGGNAVYTHNDHLGSPVVATDASGAVLWREAYTPFGEKWDRASSNDDRPGFTGHIDDASTQLTYMQARYYDPAIGRFLRPDPIGYQDQLNLHAYVANDPVNATDPDGRQILRAFKVVKRLWNAKGNPVKAGADEIASIGDDLATLGNGQAEWGDLGAIVDIALGSDLNNKATKTAAKGSSGGPRAGKDFTPAGKREIDQRNVDKHGKPTCENCGTDVVPGQQSQRGVTPPGNERQRDHIIPKSKGGDGSPENGQVLCRNCNLEKSDKLPD